MAAVCSPAQQQRPNAVRASDTTGLVVWCGEGSVGLYKGGAPPATSAPRLGSLPEHLQRDLEPKGGAHRQAQLLIFQRLLQIRSAEADLCRQPSRMEIT